MSTNETSTTDDSSSSLDACFGITGTSNCYNTAINAEQILTGMVINLIIGILCYIGFVLWRPKFRIYFQRLVSPLLQDAQRPPPLLLKGHYRLWSWVIPVFKVSDQTLLETAGLDALVSQRLFGFGVMVMVPLTVLGIGVLLPVNYTSYVAPAGSDGSDSYDDEFLRMTMSAVPSGSKLLWVHFFFTYIFIAWVCWLILYYYKEFISLRQAHDQSLIESTTIERRVSLLEPVASPHGSGPQIVSQLRLVSMARRTSLTTDGGVGSAGSVPRRGSEPASSGGGTGSQGSGAPIRAVPRSASTPMSQASAYGSMGLPGTHLVHRVHSNSVGAGAGAVAPPEQHDVADVGSSWVAPTSEGSTPAVLSTTVPVTPDLMPSPFEDQAAAGARPRPAQRGGGGLHRITDADEEEDGEEGGDVERGGGGGGSSSGSAPPEVPRWDELAHQLPLLQLADAAQFYTVLIIDEAVERFSHLRDDRLWIQDVKRRLMRAPRATAQWFGRCFSNTKGAMQRRGSGGHSGKLGHQASEAQREHIDKCNLRMEVAQELYTSIFGEDFDRIVPVYQTNVTDGTLGRWWQKRLLLDRLQYQQRQLEAAQQRLRDDVAAALEDADRKLADLEQQAGEQSLRSGSSVAQKTGEQQQSPERSGSVAQQPARSCSAGQNGAQLRSASLGGLAAVRSGSAALTGRSGSAAIAITDDSEVGLAAGDDFCSDDKPAAAAGGKAGGGACGGCCGGPPTPVQQEAKAAKLKAQADKLKAKVDDVQRALAELQGEFEMAQQDAAESRPAPCFFATFHTAHAAAYAARLNLNPTHQRMMRVMPAPAPRNVNYTTMFRSWKGRGFRPIPVFLAVIVMLLIPIGLFAGICGTIVSSACGTSTGEPSTNWFCSDAWFANFLRNVVSSTLPALLLSLWQSIVLPNWFYWCAQAEGLHFSLAALDLRCAHWFFLHDFFNVFLGGMLGGSIVWGLRAVINEPGQFFTILSQAVPASSNFFINYVSYRALGMASFRLFFPHAVVFGSILKWLRIVPTPKTEMGLEAAAVPINCRYSRDLGVLQLTVFLVTLSYGIVTPLILPFGLVYFLCWWCVWRYQMLYVYQTQYDAQGVFWIYVAHRIVICLGVMAAFTAAILATKAAYVQGLVLLCTSVAFLWWFDRYLTFRYDNVVDQVPAVGIHHAPRARVDEALYVPPPMRPSGDGWTPEWGKAWVGYGAPRYGL